MKFLNSTRVTLRSLHQKFLRPPLGKCEESNEKANLVGRRTNRLISKYSKGWCSFKCRHENIVRECHCMLPVYAGHNKGKS